MSTGLRNGAGRLDMSRWIPGTDTKGSGWQPLATPCRRFLQSKPWRRVILRMSHPTGYRTGYLTEPTGRAQLHWARNSAANPEVGYRSIVTWWWGTITQATCSVGHHSSRLCQHWSLHITVSASLCLTRAQKIPGRWPPRVQEPCFKSKEILQGAAGWFSG